MVNPFLLLLVSASALCVNGAPSGSKYIYGDVIKKSILFYEAQRSGKQPSNNRIEWRGDSAMNDRGENGEDLTGGWYDAGDHVKFGLPMAASVTNLAWGIHEFWQGYERSGHLNRAIQSIKWPLDYFLKAKVSPNKFYGQCGVGGQDHGFWGSPEDMTMQRPCFYISNDRPGSDLAGETASALAISSMVFRKANKAGYANSLLKAAKELFDLAYNHRGSYSDSITDAQNFYRSWSGYKDELAVAGLMLYKATNDVSYLKKAREFYPGYAPQAYSWDDKNAAALVLFHQLDPSKKDDAKRHLETFIRNYINGRNGITKTPKGLAFYQKWGPLRYAANAAMIALLSAKDGIIKDEGVNFAESQINYMLGDSGRSYVVGFGRNAPKRPHHRGSSCLRGQSCNIKNPGPNPNELTGALVGGPDQNDNWKDDREDYVANEVTTDYNAGFQTALAGLMEFGKSL